MRLRDWIREERLKGRRLEALPRTQRKEIKRLEGTAKPYLSSTDHWLETKFLRWLDPTIVNPLIDFCTIASVKSMLSREANRYVGVIKYVSFARVLKLATSPLWLICTCLWSLLWITRSPFPAHGETSIAVFPLSLYRDQYVT